MEASPLPWEAQSHASLAPRRKEGVKTQWNGKRVSKVAPGTHTCTPLPCASGRSALGRKGCGAGSGVQWPSTSVPQAVWIPTWWWGSGWLPGPDKLSLNRHQGLKASPRHQLTGHPVTGTCEKTRKEKQDQPRGRRLLRTCVPESFLWSHEDIQAPNGLPGSSFIHCHTQLLSGSTRRQAWCSRSLRAMQATQGTRGLLPTQALTTTQMAPSPPQPTQPHSMAPGFLGHRAEFPESTCPRRGSQQGQHTPLNPAAGARASSGRPQATA